MLIRPETGSILYMVMFGSARIFVQSLLTAEGEEHASYAAGFRLNENLLSV